jgi:hypothetical protein
MSHESDPKRGRVRDDLAHRVLEDVEAEPIPGRLIELAEKLESVLAAKRNQKTPEPR